MAEVRIVLPIPHRMLSPNARCHWRAKAAVTKSVRYTAEMLARAAMPVRRLPAIRATVGIRWFTKTKRRPDADNALASLKAAFDGFTDAGVWVSDRDTEYQPIAFGIDKQNPRVEIVISEVGGGHEKADGRTP